MQDVTLVWKKVEFKVEARDVISMICRIEDHLTLSELELFNSRGAVPLGRLAKAYAAALQFAGAPVTEQEVYESMWEPGKQEASMREVMGIVAMMIPPQHLQAQSGEGGSKKKEPKESGGSSKKPSKRRSPGDSDLPSSGS